MRTHRALPAILSMLLCGCASGPPGVSHPGRGFVLYSREPPSEARAVSREAEEFLEGLGGYLRLQVPPASLLRIYHYPHRWGLWSNLNRDAPSLRWRRGACYETDEAYVVALFGDPGRKKFHEVLRHELTHYLVAAHFCDVPPWIDEGLSQVMSSGPPFPHLEGEQLKTAQREAGRWSEKGCLRLLHVPPGRRLTTSQYPVACALTFYLLTRSPGVEPRSLVRFLETSAPGVPPEKAFSASWGTSMEDACREMVAWSGAGGQGSGVRNEKGESRTGKAEGPSGFGGR